MKIRHGIDMIHTDRIERGIRRLGQPYLDRIWTENEQAYCMMRQGSGRFASFAVRFAAKEAVAKALGTGLMRNGIGLLSIEVKADQFGSPFVVLHGAAASRYGAIGGVDIALSLTHDGNLAEASCVILTDSSKSGPNEVLR